MNIYGVLDSNNCHIDVARCETYTKSYATRHGYTKVSLRFNCGYHAEVVAEKINDKWVKVEL